MKDTSFQVVLGSVPTELPAAVSARGLDQPGVLVAFVEDVLEDFGTGIGQRQQRYWAWVFLLPIAEIVPITSSGSLASSSLSRLLSPPLRPPVSRRRPSLRFACVSGITTEERVRSRKVEKSRAMKRESAVKEVGFEACETRACCRSGIRDKEFAGGTC